MHSRGQIPEVLSSLNGLYVKEKHYSRHLLKMVMPTLFKTILIEMGTAMIELCRGGREIGLNSTYGMGRGEIRAKEQGRNQWMENY